MLMEREHVFKIKSISRILQYIETVADNEKMFSANIGTKLARGNASNNLSFQSEKIIIFFLPRSTV